MNSQTADPLHMETETIERVTHGVMHLQVRDPARTGSFWEEDLGLEVHEEPEDRLRVSSPGQDLLVLHGSARERRDPGRTGLYHLAIHVKDLASFAAVFKRLDARGLPMSPTDHTMSMALYIQDPDGIQVEITLETPERYRGMTDPAEGFGVLDAQGRVHHASEYLDTGMLRALPPGSESGGDMWSGARLGHVHLSVPRVQAGLEFYRGLGFSLSNNMAALGFADLGAGGIFTHRLALNSWQGPGALPRQEQQAGLLWMNLVYADAEELAQAAARMGAVKEASYWKLTDPWGVELRLSGTQRFHG